jgi:hypothetical protein
VHGRLALAGPFWKHALGVMPHAELVVGHFTLIKLPVYRALRAGRCADRNHCVRARCRCVEIETSPNPTTREYRSHRQGNSRSSTLETK